MAASQGAPEPGILDGIRIVDLSDGIAGPVATLILAEAGADVVAVEPPEGAANRATNGFHTWMRSKRSVVLDLDTADDRAALDRLLAAADVVVHNYGPTRARAGPRRRHAGDAVSAPDRVLGAFVAREPRRRRPPRRRAAHDGTPRRARRAAGLPRRSDLPALPDRELVCVAPRRDRHRGPPHHPPAHRSRRSRAHVPGPGCARADGDALAPGREAVAVTCRRHAQGHDRRDVVRDRRRRVDPPHGRPHQVADVHRGDRGRAPRRPEGRPGHVVPADRRLARGTAAASE